MALIVHADYPEARSCPYLIATSLDGCSLTVRVRFIHRRLQSASDHVQRLINES